MLKVPMQFFILFVGIMVFVFFQFNQPPVNFNQANLDRLESSVYQPQLEQLLEAHTTVFNQMKEMLQSISCEGTVREEEMPQMQTQRRALEATNKKQKKKKKGKAT